MLLTVSRGGIVIGESSDELSVVRDEVQTTMRLLGVTKLSQLGPHLVSLFSQRCRESLIRYCS